MTIFQFSYLKSVTIQKTTDQETEKMITIVVTIVINLNGNFTDVDEISLTTKAKYCILYGYIIRDN